MDEPERPTEKPRVRTLDASILIAGAGLAGLFTAVKLSPRPVIVISPGPLGQGAASAWAQGGIAAAVGEGDTPEAHAADTVLAGAGLVDAAAARIIASEAAERVRDLLAFGVPFDRDLKGHYLLSREAAHSAKRVVRVTGDQAGAAIMQALIATVRATPSITVLEGYDLTSLITTNGAVTGARLTNPGHPDTHFEIAPLSCAVLATGGLGALYEKTTNPDHALGQGIAIAARAGARITDAEFVQFHPTGIDCPLTPPPLASEALRGEGAILINKNGHRFMLEEHPDAELAPRDIVARAVYRQIKLGHGAYLDCSTTIGMEFETRFPTIFALCRQAGLDPRRAPIPVVPAAHYHMGGVETDLNGRTTVEGLWAVGEVARTGLHGANRLASNSLLEAVVLGARTADDIARKRPSPHHRTTLTPTPVQTRANQSATHRNQLLSRIRAIMSANVAVERDAAGLTQAARDLRQLAAATQDIPDIANVVLAARFVTASAQRRTESRGAHFRTDYPEPDPAQKHSVSLVLSDLDDA